MPSLVKFGHTVFAQYEMLSLRSLSVNARQNFEFIFGNCLRITSSLRLIAFAGVQDQDVNKLYIR
jgi:hypothetical protein